LPASIQIAVEQDWEFTLKRIRDGGKFAAGRDASRAF
jgi:hypothetical protein